VTILVFVPLAVLGIDLFGLHGLFGATTLVNVASGFAAFWWLGSRLRSLSPGPPSDPRGGEIMVAPPGQIDL